MRLALAIAAMLLGGCASQPRHVAPRAVSVGNTHYLYVTSAPLGDVVHGVTFMSGSSDAMDPAAVAINSGLEEFPERCRFVCAHELGHVLGLDHTPDCCAFLNNPGNLTPPIGWPTPAELAAVKVKVRASVYVLVLRDVPPCTERSLRWAVATWDAALGVDVLRIGEPPK